MLFINWQRDSSGAKNYFEKELAQEEYYVKDADRVKGRWFGQCAERLGLKGEVEREQYHALCDNRHPVTGEQLTPRMKSDRRVLADFTFSDGKYTTLVRELGGDERVDAVRRKALDETLAEIEAAMMTQVKRNGAADKRYTGNMVAAVFESHRTTRPIDGIEDPHDHTHVCIFNQTYDPVEKRMKAIEIGDIVRDKGYYQSAYLSRVAKGMAELGYGVERDGNSFKLAGISKETVDAFSRRTQLIDAVAEERGLNAEEKGRLGRKTREHKKVKETSIERLRSAWKARITPAQLRSIKDARHSGKTSTLGASRAMDYALAHSFERASVISEKKLLSESLIQSYGSASVAEINGESRRDNVIRKDAEGQRYVTTQEVLREEIAMVDFVRDGRGKQEKLGGARGAQNFGAGRSGDTLSAEQRGAARLILDSRDTVTGLRGGAGTGKTRMMQATVKAIEAGGKKVYTFAPSADASRGVLRSEGFKNADTVEKLLTDVNLQHEMKGQVAWIDEAGLMSVKQTKRVLDLAKSHDFRVVFSGDWQQHGSVERGDALRILDAEAGMKFAQLGEVRRQRVDNYRKAVEHLGKGDLQAGVTALDGMGAIVEIEGDDRYRHIAADYVGIVGQKNGTQTALVVAPTHAEGEKVTAEIRKGLRAGGKLTGVEHEILSLKSTNWTEAQKGDFANYEPGHVIQFTQNAKGFKRGGRVTVTGAEKGVILTSGGKVNLSLASRFQVYRPEKIGLAIGEKIRFTIGGTVKGKREYRINNGALNEVTGFTDKGIVIDNGVVIPKDFGGITHGYVVTSHASQGKTVDQVLLALGTESFAATNREQLYVSVSRGRDGVRIYTDDKAAMLEAVKNTSKRLSAIELMKGEAPPRRVSVMQRLMKIRAVKRAYEILKPPNREVAYGTKIGAR